jgi:hypothetical protein
MKTPSRKKKRASARGKRRMSEAGTVNINFVISFELFPARP